MQTYPVTKAGVDGPATHITLGRERLLGIPDVCELTGLAEATASKLMRETGHAIRLHGRLYLLESSFYTWLREQEAGE